MNIEVYDNLYTDDLIDFSFNSLYIDLKYKPYITEEDKEFFYNLGVRKMGFYTGYNFNYIIDGIVYAIDDEPGYYKHPKYGLNNIFFRSLNIRFMKINRRGGHFICDDPWNESI